MIFDVSKGILDGIRELAVILNRPDVAKEADEYIKFNEESTSSTKKKNNF